MGQQQPPKDFEEQIVTLERILQIIQEEVNVDVLLETTLQYIQAEFDYQLIWLSLYDRLDHRLLGKGGVIPNGDSSLLKQRLILQPGDLLEQVVIQLRPVGVPDLREETRAGKWRQLAQTLNIQGTILFPIRYKDRCYGVALLGTHSWGVSPGTAEKSQLSILFSALAATLYQIEVEWQHQQAKRPDQPLLNLVARLTQLQSLDHWLEQVVEVTHDFIQPNRTNIYWYYPDGRYFWRRISNRQLNVGLSSSNRPASGITIQELGEFYQALCRHQIVSIGESHSSLKADQTGRLMQQIRARSLLAAPIVLENELLGFLAVEGNNPRIWQEDEKHYLQGAAQLVAVSTPLAEMESRIQQAELDQALTAGITQAIYHQSDWEATLKKASDQVCERLQTEFFILFLSRGSSQELELVYQRQNHSRKQLNKALPPLSASDEEILRSAGILAIENWDEKAPLSGWRPDGFDLGIRSLLLCPTYLPAPDSSSQSWAGLLLIGHETPRTWSQFDQKLAIVVSQQLGVILQQWQLQQQTQTQQEFQRAIASSLDVLQQTQELVELEKRFVNFINQASQSPFVALITWSGYHSKAKISATVITRMEFAILPNSGILVGGDPLIQKLLSEKSPCIFAGTDISPETRRWLRLPDHSQLLVFPLQTTAQHPISGMIMVADFPDHRHSELSRHLLSTLVKQLAWTRRCCLVQTALESGYQSLEALNWYKQRRLEELYRVVGAGVKQLHELSQVSVTPSNSQKEALTTLRYQQILRQMNNSLLATASLLKQEVWELQTSSEIITVSNLLRRVSERIQPLVKQRQLVFEMDRAGNLSVRGDSLKLELILSEILITAGTRSVPGGKLLLGCQLQGEQWVEISVIDQGEVKPVNLMQDLQNSHKLDRLTPSSLSTPPGQHLVICKQLIEQMGGQFKIERRETGENWIRLMMPLGV